MAQEDDESWGHVLSSVRRPSSRVQKYWGIALIMNKDPTQNQLVIGGEAQLLYKVISQSHLILTNVKI